MRRLGQTWMCNQIIAPPATGQSTRSAEQADLNQKPYIRPYADGDIKDVVRLFVDINRELAPADMKKDVERYIALCLDQEVTRIPAYYDRGKGGSFWIAQLGSEIAGNYGLEPTTTGDLEIRRMYVAPQFRRRGVARAMMGHARDCARTQGARKLVLSTSELQVAAINFYLAEGFTLVGSRRATEQTTRTIGGGLEHYDFEWTVSGLDPHVGF